MIKIYDTLKNVYFNDYIKLKNKFILTYNLNLTSQSTFNLNNSFCQKALPFTK